MCTLVLYIYLCGSAITNKCNIGQAAHCINMNTVVGH